jgi:putative MATE family efflux protein
MFTQKDLRRLVLPIFLDQLLLAGVGIVSTLLLSYAGEAAVSAVSLVEMINVFIISILLAVSTGGTVVLAQIIGSKRLELAQKASGQMMMLTVLVGLLFMGMILVFGQAILNLLFGSVDPDVMKAARIYFIISSLSYPFMALYNASAGLFRAMGNSRIPMLGSMVLNISSVLGFGLAIFVFKAGITGVAVASLTSRIIASLFLIRLNFNPELIVSLDKKNFLTWDTSLVQRIVKVALPNSVENGVTQLGRVFLASIIALFGTAQITANGIVNSLGAFTLSYSMALLFASVTVVGQCVGAKEYEQARLYAKKLMRQGQIVTLVLAVLSIGVLPALLQIYTISEEARTLTFQVMILHNTIAVLFWTPGFMLASSLRAAGDARFTMMVSLTAMFVFRIPAAYLFAVVLDFGVMGVMMAMGVDWFYRFTINQMRLKGDKWLTSVV